MIANYRRVALDLHGLSTADQRWLLNNMPEHHREPLRGLLEELSLLGIPKESTLVHEIDYPAAAEEVTSLQSELATNADQLKHADGQHIANILANEPEFVIAALLKLKDWPWKETFLESLAFQRSRGIVDRLSAKESMTTNRVAEALCRYVVDKLEAGTKAIENNSEAIDSAFKKTTRTSPAKWFKWRK